MQTINGQTKTQFQRKTALALLKGVAIKPIVDTGVTVHTGKSGVLEWVELHPATPSTPICTYRVTEDSEGWLLQIKTNKATKWSVSLRGQWTATAPLFEAIERRNLINKEQIKRGVA